VTKKVGFKCLLAGARGRKGKKGKKGKRLLERRSILENTRRVCP